MTVSRWSGIRLWVYRPAGGRATWAVILRSDHGGRQEDQLLARGVIYCQPGSPASADWLIALGAALEAASRARGQRSPSASAEAGAPLGGQQGELFPA
jgi:hypothetical protein